MLLGNKDIERLWSKIDVKDDDECWVWTAKARLQSGYGLLNVWVEPNRRRNVVASRLMCLLSYGPPPTPETKALHSCDNPPCCNPKHLRWGTSKENVQDAKDRNRHIDPPRTHENPEWNAKRLAAMPKGENLHNQTLTETEAREIFRLHMGNHNVSQISLAVGKPKHVIADVCRGRSWQHLDGAPTIEELKQGGVRRGFNQFS